MSQWDALDEYDRAWALAEQIAEMQDEARKCPECGGDPGECQDADNQHAYEVTTARCYRTRAYTEAQQKRGTDHAGVIYKVTLNPAKKKSAMRKG